MPLSVLQFGLQVNDAFGVVTLLETIFESAVFILGLDILVRIAVSNEEVGMPWWAWLFLLILLLKPIIFFGFVWFGYVWQGKGWLLKLWIFVGTSLDLILPLLIFIGIWTASEEDPDEEPMSIRSVIFFLMYLVTVILFRTYIYTVTWLCWRDLAQGYDLRGFGVGLLHLIQYYRDEFMRVSSIILLVDLIWNSSLTLALDLPLEIDKQIPHLNETGSLMFRPIIPLRLSRLILAACGIYLLKKEKPWPLKYIWFPCQLVWTFFGLVMLIYITLYSENPHHHVYHVSVYCTEAILYLILNIILVRCIWKIIVYSPVTPVPLVQRSTSMVIDPTDVKPENFNGSKIHI